MSEQTRLQLSYDLSPDAANPFDSGRPSSPVPPEGFVEESPFILLESSLDGRMVDRSPSSDEVDVCLIPTSDLYTHLEVDEEDEDIHSKNVTERPHSVESRGIDIIGKVKNRLSGSFVESGGSTSSSLQEFERLEAEILALKGSQTSLSGTPHKMTQKLIDTSHSDPSLVASSKIDDKPPSNNLETSGAAATLREIEEGHESRASDSADTVSEATTKSTIEQVQDTTSSGGRQFSRNMSTESKDSREGRSSVSTTNTESMTARLDELQRESDLEENTETSQSEQKEEKPISHCMLASTDTLNPDLMNVSFMSESTMQSSSEGSEFLPTQPKLVECVPSLLEDKVSSASHTSSTSSTSSPLHSNLTRNNGHNGQSKGSFERV